MTPLSPESLWDDPEAAVFLKSIPLTLRMRMTGNGPPFVKLSHALRYDEARRDVPPHKITVTPYVWRDPGAFFTPNIMSASSYRR
jgi:hypothetical protein